MEIDKKGKGEDGGICDSKETNYNILKVGKLWESMLTKNDNSKMCQM
jgi:hypothetical protein